MVSAHLIKALNGTCPITPLHIAGEENSIMDIPLGSFGREPKWHCKSNTNLLTLFNNLFRIPSQNSWTIFQISYAVGIQVTFRVADEGFHTGQVVATTKGQETCWSCWAAYVSPMGVDSFLQDTPLTIRVRLLTVFAGRVRTGYYGQGKQTQAGSISGAITAIGQAIALATNTNPTKIVGSNKLLPPLKQMLNGFQKADPPTTKQLHVEADILEFLVQLRLSLEARKLNCSIGISL
jgi:hypothetical protein